jgi:hypothetical protein
MEFEFIFKWFRNCVSVLAWVWAVILFILGYYGNDFENNNNNNEREPGFRHFFLPIVKVLLVAPSMVSFGASAGPIVPRKGRQAYGLNDPAKVHYMSMNPDGAYR